MNGYSMAMKDAVLCAFVTFTLRTHLYAPFIVCYCCLAAVQVQMLKKETDYYFILVTAFETFIET